QEALSVVEEPAPVVTGRAFRLGPVLKERVQPFSEYVAELLARGAARASERVVNELSRIDPGAAQVPVGGVPVKEEPVLIVDVGEETEGGGAVDGEHGAADEDILEPAR